MADAIETTKTIIGGILPSTNISGSSIVNMIAWFILLLVVLIGFGILMFFIVRFMKFNKKLVIFEKVGGKWIPTRKDRAAEIKFSTSGDTIFYALKHKKYLPNPSIQMTARTYWMAIRSDGEWVNFELADLDREAKKAGARFLDKEARFARTQIQKGLKERYDKPSFWAQYGIMIMNMAWIAMIGIMTFLLFDKWIDLANTTNSGVEKAGVVMEQIGGVMAQLDNICSGSGVR